MNRTDLAKLACLLAKIIGGVTAADLTSVSPKYGMLLFMGSSMLKDALNRYADAHAPPDAPVVTVNTATVTKTR